MSHGVLVIEDCAQSFGAKTSDILAGEFGDASAFSFYPTKNLGALGDGGAVTFASKEAAAKAESLAQYGWSERYSITHQGGLNSRIDELQAAVLLGRLGRIEQWNGRRVEIVRRYSASLADDRSMIFRPGPEFVAHLAVMSTPSRDDDRKSLDRCGISTAIHYPTLDHEQQAWIDLFSGVHLPVSEELTRRILSLPCHPTMRDDEVDQVCDALRSLSR
jgi:aminotransferase EvaB